MPKFNEEGTYKVKIKDAMIADPKFSQEEDAFDIAILVADEEGHEDWWRGEISGEWGKGNFSDRTQAQITMQTLKNVGWEHGTDFTQLDKLIGMETTATVVKKKDKYFNISYIGPGGGDKPTPLDESEAKRRMQKVASFFPDENAEPPASQESKEGADKKEAESSPDDGEEGGGNPFL